MAHGDEETEIGRLEITAGENEIIIIKPAGNIKITQCGAFFIGNGKDLHFSLFFQYKLPGAEE